MLYFCNLNSYVKVACSFTPLFKFSICANSTNDLQGGWVGICFSALRNRLDQSRKGSGGDWLSCFSVSL